MKFFRNIMLVLLALISVSCSIEKYDIEYTAIAPMGGQYRIISLTDETGTELKMYGCQIQFLMSLTSVGYELAATVQLVQTSTLSTVKSTVM